ncbi:MAG: carbonic anhydrase [Saprospiraceae bacterium]|nr:carbonic anhydrase [Saprospiraceae bacterium]
MKSYQKLLLANKSWAHAQNEEDPSFFEKMAAGQNPEFLWIGCSDSRAPADKLTNTEPGQIFVHRNVANLVVHTDFNLLSVLQYAVEVLKVKHIMVVGHYGCGGVRAAMGNDSLGIIDSWIRNIKDVYDKHENELLTYNNLDERADKLAEFNVIAQVENLMKTSIVQKAWSTGEYPYLHGWVLDLKSGLIKELVEIDSTKMSEVGGVYKYKYANALV